MPAAKNKKDLIAACEKEFEKLEALLNSVPPTLAVKPQPDGSSIKDVVVHRAHWVGLFLKWYRDGQAGRDVHIPAKGYKWSDLKTYNEKLQRDTRSVSWKAARQRLKRAHKKLMEFLAGATNTALYGQPMIGHDKWTAGRFAESAGSSHYRSAAKFVRSILRGN